MTLGEFLKNLNEENEKIINYKPEDYDEYINYFVAAKANLEKIIAKGGNVVHYNDSVIEEFNKLKTTIIKSYVLKEKGHQNTSLIKGKFNNLTKAIFDYNTILCDYKKSKNLNIETIGDAFRALGQDTKKSSITTEEK